MKTPVPELVPDFAREEYLRRIIESSNLSQVQLAKCAGIPPSTLATMLTRGIAGTAVDTIARICDVLNIDLSDFVHGRFHDISTVNDQMLALSVNIRSTRRKLRYSKSAVARLLKISVSEYAEMEAGHRMIPRKHIESLAQLFDVSTDFLWGNEPSAIGLENMVEDPSIDEDEIYNFGLAIQSLRNEHTLTQTELAQAISVPVKELIDWENNVRIPTTLELTKIAQHFQVTPSALYTTADRHPLSFEHQNLLAMYEAASDRDKQLILMILGIDKGNL